METLFKMAKGNSLIADVAEDIERLWIELGRPDEPDGPSTGVIGVPVWMDESELEDMDEDEAVREAKRFNDAMELLLNLTGIWNAGGNTWHTRWERGTDEWQEYKERSYDMAVEFLSQRLWDRFCDSL